MSISELIDNASKFCKNELVKYSSELGPLFDFAYEKGIELGQKYNANVDVIKVAILLMDSKLPEAHHLGKVPEHTKMAVEFAKEYLKDYDIEDSMKENIIKCIEQHHGTKKFYSMEAEIAANADCYKFMHPKGVFQYSSILGRTVNDFEKEMVQLEKKMDEKYNILSLELVKEELTPYYNQFKELLNKVKD